MVSPTPDVGWGTTGLMISEANAPYHHNAHAPFITRTFPPSLPLGGAGAILTELDLTCCAIEMQ